MQYPSGLNGKPMEKYEAKREKEKISSSTDLKYLNISDKNRLLVSYVS
ncbi:hypothetical protein N6B72_16135 [Chryseobacterium soli]|nr:hypothetical protein [Chryseobacterium soli]MDV7698456.1 hypothetical protein [Chryseobacterium soli]